MYRMAGGRGNQRTETGLGLCFGLIRPQDIVNQIQRVFCQYYQWYIRLETMVRKRESLSELLDDLEDTYRIYGCIATQSMRLVGISSQFDSHNSWVEGQDMVKLSMVNELVADEDFQNAAREDDVFLYYNTRQECTTVLISKSTGISGAYAGMY